MPKNATVAITVIGIDIGKNVFHLIGLDKHGRIVLKTKLTRGQLDARLANMPPCLIGMEACSGAHHLSRKLIRLGHDARLMLGNDIATCQREYNLAQTHRAGRRLSGTMDAMRDRLRRGRHSSSVH